MKPKEQEYFRGRATTKLAECRDAERRIERDCEEIIRADQPDLFSGIDTSAQDDAG